MVRRQQQSHGITARYYDGTGAALTGEIDVSVGGGDFPSVATDGAGRFVVTFLRFPGSIEARRYRCTPFPGPASSLQVETASGGADLVFTWSDASDADDHVVFASDAPDGGFSGVAGIVASGAPGLTLPMPAGTPYCRAAGRNDECGVGAKQ